MVFILSPQGTKFNAIEIGSISPPTMVDYRAEVHNTARAIESNSINFFENCIFRVVDIQKVCSQSDCEDIMFSHMKAKDTTNGNKFHSTLVAVGCSLKTTSPPPPSSSDPIKKRYIIFKQGYGFTSGITNIPKANLDFSNIPNHLEYQEKYYVDYQSSVNKIRPSNESWKQLIINNINQNTTSLEYVNVGVYFKAKLLKDYGYLNNTGSNSYLILFPIILNSEELINKVPTGKFFHFISFILVNAEYDSSQNKYILKYPNTSKKLLLSYRPWPPIWIEGEKIPPP